MPPEAVTGLNTKPVAEVMVSTPVLGLKVPAPSGRMATELKPYGVAVVSLYPGLVRTEKVMEAAKWLDLTNSESPEFIGRAVAALAADPDVLRYSGKVLVAAAIAKEYGFTDIDGKTPRPLTLADV